MKTLKTLSFIAVAILLSAAAATAQTAPQKVSKPAAKKAQPAPAPKPVAAPAAATAAPVVSPFDEAAARITSSDPVARRQAAETLARTRDQRAGQYLLKALADGVPGVRAAAVDGLCQLTRRDATSRISELLLKDPDASVRQQAAGSLAYMMDPVSGPALVKALKDKDISVRYAAANTLGAMRYAPAEQPLVDALDDKDMKRIAIAALGQMQSKKAANKIAASLSDPDRFTRLEAIKALGSIGDAAPAEEIKKLLAPAEESAIRMEAALALAKLGLSDGLLVSYDFARVGDLSLKSRALEVFNLVGDARTLQYVEEAYAAEQDPVSKGMYNFTRQRLAAKLKAQTPAK